MGEAICASNEVVLQEAYLIFPKKTWETFTSERKPEGNYS